MKRNYKREYKTFHSLPKQKYRRAGRNHARRIMLKLGRVRKYSSSDIDHRDHNTWHNNLGNLRVLPRSVNRSKK